MDVLQKVAVYGRVGKIIFEASKIALKESKIPDKK